MKVLRLDRGLIMCIRSNFLLKVSIPSLGVSFSPHFVIIFHKSRAGIIPKKNNRSRDIEAKLFNIPSFAFVQLYEME